MRRPVTERKPLVCQAVLAVLADGAEMYSVEIWKECIEQGQPWPGEPRKKYDIPMLQGVLRDLEDAYFLVGRNVPASEHKGASTMMRRYYRLRI